MNKGLPLNSRREVFKMLDIEHLNDSEFQLLRERKLDKDSMCWAVRHLSECRRCCRLAPELTAQEIKDALAGTPYGRADIIEQTVDYYFQALSSKTP
jgi:MoaA/NifB/PqqE/SkfB family radical SAM enzyme